MLLTERVKTPVIVFDASFPQTPRPGNSASSTFKMHPTLSHLLPPSQLTLLSQLPSAPVWITAQSFQPAFHSVFPQAQQGCCLTWRGSPSLCEGSRAPWIWPSSHSACNLTVSHICPQVFILAVPSVRNIPFIDIFVVNTLTCSNHSPKCHLLFEACLGHPVKLQLALPAHSLGPTLLQTLNYLHHTA